MTLLDVQQLTTRFYTRNGVLTALNKVSFSVMTGQTLGIVGESGSGKSVACQSFLGLLPKPQGRIESGQVLFEGQNLLAMSAAQLRQVCGLHMGVIFQDPMTSLNPFMSIESQLTEPLRIHQTFTRAERHNRALKALDEVGLNNAEQLLKAFPFELSGGMRQRVMIAMALINNPKLLIADEPTTALDVCVQAQILDLLKSLQQQRQLTVIFISHDLGVVSHMADDVIVMKKGEVVERGCGTTLFLQPQHEYTKMLVAASPRDAKPTPSLVNTNDADILQLKGVFKSFKSAPARIFARTPAQFKLVLNHIDLAIKPGEVLGLVGESGSGKSTLARIIMNLVIPDSGDVIVQGQALNALTPQQRLNYRQSIQMIFQDPYASLNPRMTVFEALSEPLWVHKLCSPKDIQATIEALLDEVGLPLEAALKYPHEFSGGQRQRIAIARALVMQPKIIIADEPVSALDVTIQRQILDLLLQLTQKRRLTILFISHDLAVIRYVCDRVIVLHQGTLVESGPTESIFQSPQHSYTQQLLLAAKANHLAGA